MNRSEWGSVHMNRSECGRGEGSRGEEREGKEMDGCPLTAIDIPTCQA
jgi:hypothetical protein